MNKDVERLQESMRLLNESYKQLTSTAIGAEFNEVECYDKDGIELFVKEVYQRLFTVLNDIVRRNL